MDLGQSFSPASQNQQDPNVARRKRTPVQQALQTVSLQLPTAGGAGLDPGAAAGTGTAPGTAPPNAIAADLLSGRSGSIARGSASQPRTQALLNAMMASGGTNTGGVTARGGGFAGGGFGDLGKFKPPSVDAGGPMGGAGGGEPGGGLADLISKLPGLQPGGMPGLPTPPSAGAKPPMGMPPGIPPIPPSLRPPVVAKPPVLPPINPNIPGGGAVDFNRGSDPRFNTPTGQAPPTNGGITGGMNPTPAPAPVAPAPAPVAPPTGAPPASGAPPQYGGASGTTYKPMPPGMGPGVPGYATWYAAGYR